MKVKLVLPALTEATSPLFRPIKYSLFPPLGLATLAAYLDPNDDVTLVDEHVEKLNLNDSPDLVVIQVYITSAFRAYRIADHYRRQGAFVALGGLHVTSLPDEAAAHADAVFLGPGEDIWPEFLRDFRAGHPQRRYQSRTRSLIAFHHPPRSHQTPPVPRSQLDCRFPRLSARLRLLLQGSILSGRQIVLHADRRRRTRRNRPPARPSFIFPRRPSLRKSPLCGGPFRRNARHGTRMASRRNGEHHPLARPLRESGRQWLTQPLRWI